MFVLPLNVSFCGNIHNNELIENDYVLIWAVIFLWFYFKLWESQHVTKVGPIYFEVANTCIESLKISHKETCYKKSKMCFMLTLDFQN